METKNNQGITPEDEKSLEYYKALSTVDIFKLIDKIERLVATSKEEALNVRCNTTRDILFDILESRNALLQ